VVLVMGLVPVWDYVWVKPSPHFRSVQMLVMESVAGWVQGWDFVWVKPWVAVLALRSAKQWVKPSAWRSVRR